LSLAGLVHGADFQSSFDASSELNGSGSSGYSWSSTAAEGSSVTIDEGNKAEGTGSLKVLGTGANVELVSSGTDPGGIVFYQFKVKPVAEASEEAETVIDAGGARIGFVGQEGEGKVVGVTGSGSAVMADVSYGLDANHESENWLTLTVRVDGTVGVWDGWVNGYPAFSGMERSAGERVDSFAVNGESEGALRVDNFHLSAENPLFSDADRDGLPDAYEVAKNLNATVNDREEDSNSSGSDNLTEYVSEMEKVATGVGEEGGGRTLYVDLRNGDDSGTGLAPYPMNGDAPKKTLDGALDAVRSGDTIVIIARGEPYSIRGGGTGIGGGISIKITGDLEIKAETSAPSDLDGAQNHPEESSPAL